MNNLPVYKKISAIVIMLTVLLIISSVFGISKVNSIAHEMKTVQTESIPLVELISDITIKQLEKSIAIERAMRIAGLTKSNETISEIHHVIEKLAKEIDLEITEGEAILATAKTHALSKQQGEELSSIEKKLVSMNREHTNFEIKANQLMTQIESKSPVSTSQIKDLEKSQTNITHHLETLITDIEKMTEHALTTVEQDEASALKWMIIISSFSVAVAVIFGVMVTRSITTPLKYALQVTNTLASGDLTVKIASKSKDEIGQLLQAMRKMSDIQRDLLTEISSSAEQLSAASQEVSVTTTQSATNIESEKDQLNQVAVAMNEMSATVHDVAENASQAAFSSEEANKGTQDGRQAVEQVALSIDALALEIEKSKAAITRLSKETESVDTILGVITAIAEQTNLLALNAAIEAARAGEQGRGFAVVADEVRSLASRTQESIATIQQTVTSLKKEALLSVDAMESGNVKANETIKLSKQAESSLDDISQAVTKMNDLNLQIASAAEQQNVVVEEMNKSVVHITETEDENYVGAQQISLTTDEIAQQAEHLKTLLTKFTLI